MTPPSPTLAPRRPRFVLEPLEARCVLSATAAAPTDGALGDVVQLHGQRVTMAVGTATTTAVATMVAHNAAWLDGATAKIDWGNGGVTVGRIEATADPGFVRIVGTAAYAATGTYTVTVDVASPGTPDVIAKAVVEVVAVAPPRAATVAAPAVTLDALPPLPRAVGERGPVERRAAEPLATPPTAAGVVDARQLLPWWLEPAPQLAAANDPKAFAADTLEVVVLLPAVAAPVTAVEPTAVVRTAVPVPDYLREPGTLAAAVPFVVEPLVAVAAVPPPVEVERPVEPMTYRGMTARGLVGAAAAVAAPRMAMAWRVRRSRAVAAMLSRAGRASDPEIDVTAAVLVSG